MSESEPPITYRNTQMLSKPGQPLFPGTSSRGVWLLRERQPVYRRHDFSSGFATEHGNLPIDVKGKRRVANATSANTDATGRGGVARSSVETPVMGVERRGHGVSEMESINLRIEGRSR
jgi:hypothetical protein